MSKKYKFTGVAILVLAILIVAGWYLHRSNLQVLNPAGTIAAQQRQLIIIAAWLMLVVAIPVFSLTFWISWKYRESNNHPKKKYSPEWDGNRLVETTWWLIPSLLILILSVITWRSTHELDPSKALVSSKKPLTIQVVALDWKWLFIYPQQNIATVNYVQFPAHTPVDFVITSDAPMNSFWIPQLGGQIYAMAGMTTQMHLMASRNGSYHGLSANISGRGFSGMHFVAKATSGTDFSQWLTTVKHSSKELTLPAYNQLATNSVNNPVSYYANPNDGLFDKVLLKYMVPQNQLAGFDSQTAAELSADMPGMSQ